MCSTRNFMKFNKKKCRVIHMSTMPGTNICQGPSKGIWWYWWAQSSTWASTMLLPEGKLKALLATLEKCCLLLEVVCSLIFLFSIGETIPGVLCEPSSSGLLSTNETCKYWKQSNKRWQGWLRDWGTSHTNSLRELGLSSLEKWILTRTLMHVYKYLKEGCRQDVFRLFSVVPSDMIRGNGHKLKHRRFHVNISKHIFLLWGWLNVGTGCPRNCENSICGNIQNSYGHSPGQLTLDAPAWAGWVIVSSLLRRVLKAKR